MKYIFAIIVVGSVLITSCGKQESKNEPTRPEDEEISITNADPVELLDSGIDVPVSIGASEITFLDNKSSSKQGTKGSCSTSVSNNEVYQYLINGNALVIQTREGRFTFQSLNNEASGIHQNWVWKGKMGNMYTVKTINFLSNGRAIIRTNCEV